MADISKLSRLFNGVARQVDLSLNTLVVDNLKVKLGGSSQFTFSGSLTAGRTITMPDADVNLGYIAALVTLSGVSGGATDLGTFTGTTISDNRTIKQALQDLETYVETVSANNEFLDSLFRIKDNSDPSKKIAFEASGISTGTVRTITMPDADVNLADANNAILKNGTRSFTADQSMGGNKLTNLADPISSQDAVTLAYMNARLNGLTPKAPVRAATTANITLSGAQTIDTVSIVAGNRVLVKNQTLPEQNGIYVAAAGAWSRAADMDSLTPFDEFNGAWTAVQEGSQAGQVYVQYGTVATVGTDPVTWAFYNPIAGLIGGDMITFAGSTFSVDLATVSGLESSNPGNVAGQLRVKLEASNPSLRITGSNELAAKLDAAGAITSGSGGLIVGTDGSTTEIASNQVRVKDAGITAAKLNTNVADQSTITGGAGSALAVQNAPLVRKSMVAGEAFAANTSFLVRMAVSGETAGRVYKADKDASVTDKFYVVGVALSTSAVSAGQSITVVSLGTSVLGSSDTPFVSGDVGKAVFLTSSGAFSTTAPSAANEAVARVGIVENTDRIWVQPGVVGVN
jgi:hypothetical protein